METQTLGEEIAEAKRDLKEAKARYDAAEKRNPDDPKLDRLYQGILNCQQLLHDLYEKEKRLLHQEQQALRETPADMVSILEKVAEQQEEIAEQQGEILSLPSSSNLKRTAADDGTTQQQQKRTKAFNASSPTVGPHAEPLTRWAECVSRDEHETRTVDDYNAMKRTKVTSSYVSTLSVEDWDVVPKDEWNLDMCIRWLQDEVAWNKDNIEAVRTWLEDFESPGMLIEVRKLEDNTPPIPVNDINKLQRALKRLQPPGKALNVSCTSPDGINACTHTSAVYPN